jgi:hypothetical protein
MLRKLIKFNIMSVLSDRALFSKKNVLFPLYSLKRKETI